MRFRVFQIDLNSILDNYSLIKVKYFLLCSTIICIYIYIYIYQYKNDIAICK